MTTEMRGESIIGVKNSVILICFHEKLMQKQGRIHDRPSRGGWVGAVSWRAGAVGSAVHTTASVTCNWTGAVMLKLLAKRGKRQKSKGRTDRQTI